MQLQLRDFASLVSAAAAAVQASSRALVDLSVGSMLRAILEANASVALWLQWLILQVQSMTRAATSQGDDLDSWMADFALARLPAVVATGQVRFARFATTEAALVPAGALVRTADAALGFVVREDAAHPAWNAAQSGFVMGAGVGSVVVPVEAAAAGSEGNVLAGSITLIADALAGVDTVANDGPLTGGLDAESDAALRLRFRDCLASRSRATPVAVGHAVASLRQGLRYSIAEGVGTGVFVVTVDDGTSTTLAATAPTISGESVTHLIEAAFQEVDVDPVILPYYNAANPAMPYLGPGNTGAAQNTRRVQRAQLQLKPGVPATTGTQVAPAVDAGWVGLATVTIAHGQATVTGAHIAALVTAPALSFKLPELRPGFSTMQAFTVNGTFVVPQGVTRLRVRAIGGGGGGGGNTTIGGGGGGGGGGYAEGVSAVGPGQVIAVTVGGGGAARPNNSGSSGGNSGGNGGASSFGAFLSAVGGTGGQGSLSGGQGNSGPGGSGSGGTVNMTGSAGNAGHNAGASGYGGHGGAAAAGGGAGGASSGLPSAGVSPGGGGAGGGGNFAGAVGAAGLVIVEY